MGHALEGQAASVRRDLFALDDAPERQATAAGSEDLAVRAERNTVRTTSQLVIGRGDRMQRRQVPDVTGCTVGPN